MNILKYKLSLLILTMAMLGFETSKCAEISGTVIDAVENRALGGVNIMIQELNIGTGADANGHYTFTNIPAGNYTLTVSMIGYCRQNHRISLSENDTLNLPIELTYVVLEIVEDQDTKSYHQKVASFTEPITIIVTKVRQVSNHFEVETTIRNNTDLAIHLLRYPHHLRLQILTLDKKRISSGIIASGSGRVPLPNTDSLFTVQPNESKTYPVQLTSLHKIDQIEENKIQIRVIYTQKYLPYLPIPLVPCDANPEEYADEMKTNAMLLRGEYKSELKPTRIRWFAH